MTFAPGGAFTEFSHEFQTICDAGEDYIYVNREKHIAINEEVMSDETLEKLSVSKDDLERVKTAEVGNIFNFGRQKAEDLGLVFTSENGEEVPVWMGSYGVGTTRLIGVLVEKFADEKGLVWPEHVAPFKVHLISLSGGDDSVSGKADMLYEALKLAGVEVLYDDRDVRAGEKFADSDLLGIPHRVIVSGKTESGMYEVVDRQSGETSMLSEQEVLAL